MTGTASCELPVPLCLGIHPSLPALATLIVGPFQNWYVKDGIDQGVPDVQYTCFSSSVISERFLCVGFSSPSPSCDVVALAAFPFSVVASAASFCAVVSSSSARRSRQSLVRRGCPYFVRSSTRYVGKETKVVCLVRGYFFPSGRTIAKNCA